MPWTVQPGKFGSNVYYHELRQCRVNSFEGPPTISSVQGLNEIDQDNLPKQTRHLRHRNNMNRKRTTSTSIAAICGLPRRRLTVRVDAPSSTLVDTLPCSTDNANCASTRSSKPRHDKLVVLIPQVFSTSRNLLDAFKARPLPQPRSDHVHRTCHLSSDKLKSFRHPLINIAGIHRKNVRRSCSGRTTIEANSRLDEQRYLA